MNNENHLFARQGDVHFVTAAIPSGAKRVALRPFALGEVTGHSHRVVVEDEPMVEMYELHGHTYVRVSGECEGIHIRHEEHDPTATTSVLPSGWEGRSSLRRSTTKRRGSGEWPTRRAVRRRSGTG